MLTDILKLLMPDKCLVCGGVTLLGVPVCADCIGDFCSLFEGICPVCKESRRECVCGRGAFAQSGRFLFYYYTPVSKAVIASVKHRLDKNGADFVAELIYRSLKDGKNFDLVVYPPRSKKNVHKYGFDQAKEISSALASKLGIKASDALTRSKSAGEQKLLSASQRRKNAMGMFGADKVKLAGCKRALLFDDVYTTGATVKACVSALRAAGVREVVVFTAAYTPKTKPTPIRTAGAVKTSVGARTYNYKYKGMK